MSPDLLRERPTRAPTRRRHNFSGGPGALPDCVLEATREAIREVPEVELSLLGISHRSDWFRQVVAETEDNVRSLLGLGGDWHVLLLQGGSSLQFSMIPMTLLRGRDRPAEYLRTGYWSAKSIPDARLEGPVRVLWDGEPEGFRRLPRDGEMAFAPDASYLHYVSNETVEGLQFHRVPGREGVTRVCDMSSDFLSRPTEAERFDLIYAHSQKNLGPAGVTLVLLRDEVLRRVPEGLPSVLDYRSHAEKHSIYNTPPVFAIYVTMLVTRWLREEVGGLEAMDALNRAKAESLYAALDASDGFYRGRAAVEDRSLMNVVFNLPSPGLEHDFLRRAEEAGLHGLGGHRSLGGVRASLYNAMTLEGVEALREFMDDYRRVAPAR